MLQLREHQATELPRKALDYETGEWLWRNHGKVIDVTFPSPRTDNRWLLNPGGWVGHIPLPDGPGIRLQPKVPLGNLFRMLEYAYRLDSIKFPKGITDCGSLEEYFENLAHLLAKRILDRVRRGIHRAYTDRSEDLHVVRGRIDIGAHARRPWRVGHLCHFDDHTGDIDDNQILAWTLFGIARSGLKRREVYRDVLRAYRAVAAVASLEPYDADSCIGRVYHRLNEDYEPLHALCRFFLEHRGPTHQTGERGMVPFLVDMAHVFELFVAEWLGAQLPQPYHIASQKKVVIDAQARLSFRIDLVLRNKATGQALCVLDTKYKRHTKPANADIFQIVSYAHSQRCRRGVLIYPEGISEPLNADFEGLQIKALTFSLDDDLDAAGHSLMQELLGWLDKQH